MPLKTKAIRKAAKTYLANRNKQSVVKWDKEADQKALFQAMRDAGLTGLSAMAGTHFGYNQNAKHKKFVVIDIDEEITIKSYKDFSEYWEDCTH